MRVFRLWQVVVVVALFAWPHWGQTLQTREKTLLETIEHYVFERVNEERTRQGLNPVSGEAVLTEIARGNTRDMLELRFFDHVNLDGVGPSERVHRAHHSLVGEVAENIWSGTRSRGWAARDVADWIMDGLMGSPRHSRIILTPEMTHLGVGVYSSIGDPVETNEIMVTQLFASVRSYTETPVPESLSRNQTVRFRLLDLDGGRSNAQYFELQPIDAEGATVEPMNIEEARIEASPGTYQLRFLYNYDTGRPGLVYGVDGPYVTVR